MFSVPRSLRPAEVTVTDRDKQNTDIHDPDLCQRVQTVQTEQKMDKQKQGRNNFSTAMTRKNLTVTWTRLVGSKKDQKINTTSGKMKGGYICLCKNGF